ncbi:hypothetical protein EC846_0843 [Acinetobacter sp. BIGb0102]|uniref:hypothetical protein n=1 Tax=Acinetobacter sp. BIGb0102 TaxID=2485131 RepID=UPI000F4FDE4C|nr:hypothetical protein [Acinetobacter sp. BIGb0102]RPE31380.1 hypothetical protein EC846_0843 [Acinetobacter sp. BIGb0102]
MNREAIKSLISKNIRLDKDLPFYIFKENNYIFWFFERPLLDYKDILDSLIHINSTNFKEEVFITFGNLNKENFSYYSFRNKDELESIDGLEKSRLEYPIIIMNKNCDWLAFESSREGIGVIALKTNRPDSKEIERKFNKIFITMSELEQIREKEGWYSKVAAALILNYYRH